MEIKIPVIKLKEYIGEKEYEDIYALKEICTKIDNTALKLELDFKINKTKKESTENFNEFMFYDNNILIGYIGICDFGGQTLELNGMVHPDYRRNGVFTKIFSLVKDELNKRNEKNVLLLSDSDSIAGINFIKKTGGIYEHSEYEMFLKKDFVQEKISGYVELKNATIDDAKEIAYQNSIYFDIEYNGEVFSMPEERELSFIYMAVINNIVIGKVHVEINKGMGGIYGLGVLPEYRSKGYGRQILLMAIEKLKEQNSKEIMLQVEIKNKNALNLYKSCGFEEISVMDYYELIF
nr:GNAT family N-acetyltransferase [Sedimentibacter sp.]